MLYLDYILNIVSTWEQLQDGVQSLRAWEPRLATCSVPADCKEWISEKTLSKFHILNQKEPNDRCYFFPSAYRALVNTICGIWNARCTKEYLYHENMGYDKPYETEVRYRKATDMYGKFDKAAYDADKSPVPYDQLILHLCQDVEFSFPKNDLWDCAFPQGTFFNNKNCINYF